MPIRRAVVDMEKFNQGAVLPYDLRLQDFQIAMQDVYDFFFDMNFHLTNKGLGRFEDMCRKAILSGFLSEMVSASLAKHSRALVQNQHHNGHPDLVKHGVYPGNSVQAGEEGIEIKTTNKRGAAVDTHGARNQWMCVFVYGMDSITEPVPDRNPLQFTEIYLGRVELADFRHNPRKTNLGTRTATLDKVGVTKFRQSWIYRLQ